MNNAYCVSDGFYDILVVARDYYRAKKLAVKDWMNYVHVSELKVHLFKKNVKLCQGLYLENPPNFKFYRESQEEKI
jgi:hypothetical protein